MNEQPKQLPGLLVSGNRIRPDDDLATVISPQESINKIIENLMMQGFAIADPFKEQPYE